MMEYPLTPLPNYAAFLKFMRVRMDELGMTQRIMDHVAGWADGSTGQFESGKKHMGPGSFFIALNALGCEMVAQPNPQLTARILNSHMFRPRRGKSSPVLRGRLRTFTFLSEDLQINGRKGGLTRAANQTPEQRKKSARHAALIRWAGAKEVAKNDRA
jgi:hypothetical protein